MAKLSKAISRDRKKLNREKHGVDGRSLFVIEEVKSARSLKIKREREQKERLENS